MIVLSPSRLHVRPEDRLTAGKRRPAKDPIPPKEKTPSKPPRAKKPQRKWRFVNFFLTLCVWGLILGAVGAVYFGYDLPDIQRLEQITRKPGIKLLARDGSLLATYGDLYGRFVSVEKMPQSVPQALMATEDRRFYHHWGLDPVGIIRALWVNYRSGATVQGGSTITQQLAKNFLFSEGLYTHKDRSLRRKIQELLLALWLEHKFSKDQILSIYLNRVYLGAGVYGVDAAAQKYFHKPVEKLTLYESAMLVGLLKAPSKYAPTHNPEKAHARAQVVLQTMVEAGFITEAQRLPLKTMNPQFFAQKAQAMRGRYFADWVLETLDEYIGEVHGDVEVHTTLDTGLQDLAEHAVQGLLASDGPALKATQGALVSLTADGGVRAMVGGVNYGQSQFNRATQAHRQMGSTFKYFIYLCALEAGHHASDMISDHPLQIGNWKPGNYYWKAKGEVSIREGFAYSINAVAVRLAHEVGVKKMQKMALRLGLTSPQPNDLTIALGSGQATLLELTCAYAAVASGGDGVWAYGIEKVQDSRTGQVFYERHPQGAGHMLEPSVVAEALDFMQAAFSWGTAKNSKLDRPCAGKTGTSQKYRDAWAVGFTPDLITGVWTGNDNETPMLKATGGKLSGKIWKTFMAAAHQGFEPSAFHVSSEEAPEEAAVSNEAED